MKVQPLDPNQAPPEVLASHLVEFVAEQKPDIMLAIVGKRDPQTNSIIASVSHSSMGLEQLLYLHHCLDVHIRMRTTSALEQMLSPDV